MTPRRGFDNASEASMNIAADFDGSSVAGGGMRREPGNARATMSHQLPVRNRGKRKSTMAPNYAEEDDDDDERDGAYRDDSVLFEPFESGGARGGGRKRARMSTGAARPRGRAVQKAALEEDMPEEDLSDDDDEEFFEPEDLNTPLHMTHAHLLKENLFKGTTGDFLLSSHAAGSSSPGGAAALKGKRVRPEHDPENVEIKNMRQYEHLSWTEICRILNEERRSNGQIPDLSDAAVYSRFVRNAPRIAAQMGEDDFDTKDYMHLKTFGTRDNGPGPRAGKAAGLTKKAQWNKRIDEALVEAVSEARKAFWSNVSDVLEARTTKKIPAEACAERFHLL